MILLKVLKHKRTILALSTVKLDQEVAEASGKSIGLEPLIPDKSKQEDDLVEKATIEADKGY